MKRLLAVAILLVPGLARAADSQGVALHVYPPKSNEEMGVDVEIVSGTWASDGVGIGGSYDSVIAKDAGPGHVTAGAFGLFALTNDDRPVCRRHESITGIGGRVKYVLDIHPVLRPWVGAGLGMYVANRGDSGCNDPGSSDDVGLGIPISLGLEIALDQLSLGVAATGHTTSSADDFSALSFGLAWRF